MLSRLSAPAFRSHANLSRNVFNIIPATYTTLHGGNRTERHPLVAGCKYQLQHKFTPVTGVTHFDTSLLSQRLFHVTRQNNDGFNWKKYTRDIEVPDWVKKASPQALTKEAPKQCQPYLRLMRFDRPIGTWLLYLPCTWAISLAAFPGHLPSISMLALFGAGALLMRGAGCTINDLWDVDFDKKVARTRDRPLASGEITKRKAIVFLGAQLGVSLAILLSLNSSTILLGFLSVVPVAVYPLMKRYTSWPQAFLGMTINWGALMGYSAVYGSVAWSVVLPLYASCIAWTLFYDTIYAHQDKNDDIIIGVKSTALLFGNDTKTWLAKFGGVMIGGLTLTGLMAGQTLPYYLGVVATAGHLYWQASTVNLNNPDDCGKKFRSNRNLGLILLGAIIAGNLMKKDKRHVVTHNEVKTV